MARQGFDLQLTRHNDKGWRATFYPTGMAFADERHRIRVGAYAVACCPGRSSRCPEKSILTADVVRTKKSPLEVAAIFTRNGEAQK